MLINTDGEVILRCTVLVYGTVPYGSILEATEQFLVYSREQSLSQEIIVIKN